MQNIQVIIVVYCCFSLSNKTSESCCSDSWISVFASGVFQAEQRSSGVALQSEEERRGGVQEVEVDGQ